jgi:predicted Zn-dependent protease
MAQAYLRLGDAARAQELAAQARALRPDFEVTTLLMSNLFLQQGDVGRALTVLTEHLERNPDCAGVCQQAAVILARLGRAEQARSLGQRAVRLLDAAQLRAEAQRARQFVQSLG